MLRVNQVKLRVGHTPEQLKHKTAELLHISEGEILSVRVVRRSLDARKKPELFYSYSLNVEVNGEDRVLRRFGGKEGAVCRADEVSYTFPKSGVRRQKHPTVIVGTGPAGLFCGYFLALHGYKPILLERGRRVEERWKDVETFWESGVLNPASNVQFGEGGAGTFSDGKLNTLVKDRDGRNAAVLRTFVQFGAKESICYEAKPHLGTDALTGIVRRMREEIIRLGGEVRFESQMTDLCREGGRLAGVVINGGEILPCEQLVLAIGHSARDTFRMLYEKEIPMEAKAFAVGFRVEHPQRMIDESQYGAADVRDVGAAAYKLAARGENGRAVYTFCMCPGGYVVNASSEEGRTAVNGMSYSGRDGKNANSAVIVSVMPEDFGSEHPLAGIAFQRQIEERAFALGKGKIPVQRYGDFKACLEEGEGEREGEAGEERGHVGGKADGRASVSEGGIAPQCRGQYCWADLSGILPKECNEAFLDGMKAFGRQIKGFDRPDTILSGVESRTSSPVRIVRDEGLQSMFRGIYPCGEGAGYAGGITSAAMDGMRVAEAIAAEFAPFEDT